MDKVTAGMLKQDTGLRKGQRTGVNIRVTPKHLYVTGASQDYKREDFPEIELQLTNPMELALMLVKKNVSFKKRGTPIWKNPEWLELARCILARHCEEKYPESDEPIQPICVNSTGDEHD